mmetsp:Transcript_49104/g.74696  ORF Transcript_49104/g.74696 Transcript_49104/m.74696 type:complete len:138 (-) Transcript_49104:138-551(-)
MAEMHEAFVAQGFVLKSPQEVARIRKKKGATLDAGYKRAEDDYKNHLLAVERLMQEETAAAGQENQSAEAIETTEERDSKRVGEHRVGEASFGPPCVGLFGALFVAGMLVNRCRYATATEPDGNWNGGRLKKTGKYS